jgi:hypothetical protein
MRGCTASALSIIGINRHLSNAVHGCDSPNRTTVVVERSDLGGVIERSATGTRYALRYGQPFVER